MSVHVYGIVPATAELKSLSGRQGTPARLVCAGDLAAVVSDLPDADHTGRDDLMAHSRVLESVVEDLTVLPMRYAVVAESDDAVRREILDSGSARLTALLADLDGMVQLTVGAYHDEGAAMRDLLTADAGLRALRDDVRRDGSRYDLSIRLGEAVAKGLEAMRARDAQGLIDKVAPLAEQLSVNEPVGQHHVLDAALLVRRDRRAALDEVMGTLSESAPPRLRLRYVGPQPPYAFVGQLVAEEPVWA
jgi:hypothetical protein